MIVLDDALLILSQVYGVGTNHFGCLGLGHKKPALLPACAEELCGKVLSMLVLTLNGLISTNEILGFCIFCRRRQGRSGTDQVWRHLSLGKRSVEAQSRWGRFKYAHIPTFKISLPNKFSLFLG